MCEMPRLDPLTRSMDGMCMLLSMDLRALDGVRWAIELVDVDAEEA